MLPATKKQGRLLQRPWLPVGSKLLFTGFCRANLGPAGPGGGSNFGTGGGAHLPASLGRRLDGLSGTFDFGPARLLRRPNLGNTGGADFASAGLGRSLGGSRNGGSTVQFV